MPKKLDVSKRKPPTTPEENENECIDLAYSLAKQQLRDGTASSQVITEFIRAGSRKQKLEIEELKRKNELLVAKVDALESQKRSEDLYEKAITAMKQYAGYGDENEL